MLKELAEKKTCSMGVVHNFYIRKNVYIKGIYKGKSSRVWYAKQNEAYPLQKRKW